MAPLLTRLRVMKVKVEAAKGTKVGGDQAILAFDQEIQSTAPFIERRGNGARLGPIYTGVLGERSGSCNFSAELRGDGSQGLEAGLAILLQGCGLVKASQVYSTHSAYANQKTISIDAYEDGIKKGLAGAMGNCTIIGEIGKRVMCNFEYFGAWQAPTDAAIPAFAPSSTPPMKLSGATFSIGGSSIQIANYELNFGTQVVMRPDPDTNEGFSHYLITDLTPEISLDPEADLVANYDFNGLWLAGTEATIVLVLTDGTDTITITLENVQIKELQGGDRDGIATYDYTGQCRSDGSNAAIKIAVT